jgi:beta-phosphoglucomutase-like phosphatase (HAD superfamily)
MNSNFLKLNEIFFMIDLDGTLIDTEKIHFDGYYYALEQFNIKINFNDYIILSNYGKVDEYLKEIIPKYYNDVKKIKNSYIKTINEINLINGAEELINYIYENNINHVVVTNTSRDNVDFFIKKQPILNKLKNWIVKEDYNKSKPDPECYNIAKLKFYKNEKNIIGIENTICGYNSIKKFSNKIFIVSSIINNQEKYFNNINGDINIIDNLNFILKTFDY